MRKDTAEVTIQVLLPQWNTRFQIKTGEVPKGALDVDEWPQYERSRSRRIPVVQRPIGGMAMLPSKRTVRGVETLKEIQLIGGISRANNDQGIIGNNSTNARAG